MKKTLSVIICAAMLAAFASCTTTQNTVSEDVSTEASSEISQTVSETSVQESEASSETSTAEQSVFEGKAPDREGGSKVLVSEGCSYTALGTKHGQYPDDGTKLTDGIFGGDAGVGYQTSVGVFVIDLGDTVHGIADLTALAAGDTWGIVAPSKASYSASLDGQSWTAIGTCEGDDVVKEEEWGGWNYYYFPLSLDESVCARYIRIELTGAGMNWAWMHEIAVWSYEELVKNELHEFNGTEELSNLTLANRDDDSMGDKYAPGYCVHSNYGYNKAEMKFELSQVDANNYGTKDGHVTCYVFLGISIKNEQGYWQNCCDAGFTYDGDSKGWHLFWATATDQNGKRGWESNTKTLNPKHDYQLVLDSSFEDGKAKLTAIDLADGSVADELTFDLWGSKKDGSNTYYLTDIAIDWADEKTLVDTKGNPTTEENWIEVTKANMGQGIHLNNVRLYDISLYKGGERYLWTKEHTSHRGIWSDKNMPFYVETTKVYKIIEDYEYIIDLDLG